MFLLAIIFNLFSWCIVLRLLTVYVRAERKRDRAGQIIAKCNAFSKSFYDASVAIGGYSITKSDLFLAKFEQNLKALTDQMAELKSLAGPDRHQKIDDMSTLLDRAVNTLREAKAMADSSIETPHAESKARQMYKEVRGYADQFQELLRQLAEEDWRLVTTPQADGKRTLTIAVSSAATGNLLLLLGLFLMLFRHRQSSK